MEHVFVKLPAGTKYWHLLPHINKNGYYSSFVHVLRKAELLRWWTFIHTIELMMFCFIPNTPVVVWECMEVVFDRYGSRGAPDRCLTIILCEIAIERFGGVCKAAGHRHVPSCGRSMPLNLLFWSLNNLMQLVMAIPKTRDTNELYAMAQRPPCKGGVQGVGPLISTHAARCVYPNSCGLQ